MNNKRKAPADRREEILNAALDLAGRIGYTKVSRDKIADKIGLTGQAVQYHIGTMAKLRRDLMRHAIRKENLVVIGQGLAARDSHAAKAPEALRRKALEAML
jgi:AcrR family transcriptional regulator